MKDLSVKLFVKIYCANQVFSSLLFAQTLCHCFSFLVFLNGNEIVVLNEYGSPHWQSTSTKIKSLIYGNHSFKRFNFMNSRIHIWFTSDYLAYCQIINSIQYYTCFCAIHNENLPFLLIPVFLEAESRLYYNFFSLFSRLWFNHVFKNNI